MPDGTMHVGIYIFRTEGDRERLARLAHVSGDVIGGRVRPLDPKTGKPTGEPPVDFNTGATLESATVEETYMEKRICSDFTAAACAGVRTLQIPYSAKRIVTRAADGTRQEWWFPPKPAIEDVLCPMHR